MTLAQKLLIYREENQLKPIQVAYRLGMNVLAYARYEKGAIPAKQEIIDRMSELLECDLAPLIDESRLAAQDAGNHSSRKKEPDDTDLSVLAVKLRTLRTEKRLSKVEVARQSGIIEQIYRRYEIRTRPKNPDVYQRLAEVLDCDVDYLRNDDSQLRHARDDKRAPSHRGNVEIQYLGRAIALRDLLDTAESMAGTNEIDLYIKTDESIVYIVGDEYSGSFQF